MVAKIIDGKAVAQHVRQECKLQTQALKAQGVTPGLAVIIVGDNPASKVYVANKVRACTEVGLVSTVYAFAADTPDQEVLDKILALNADPLVHGILVQLPLPKHFDVKRVLAAISVDKDVDGFHLYNVGALAQGETVVPPCTPYWLRELRSKSEPVDLAVYISFPKVTPAKLVYWTHRALHPLIRSSPSPRLGMNPQ